MNTLTHSKEGFTAYKDIEALETIPLADHNIPNTTYEALRKGTSLNPEFPAISFFATGDAFDRPRTLTHRELFAKVTQTANALHRLGIGRNDVVAYILPNLPETHFVIWGGSAAGQVLAINPLLEAEQIADLLRAANVKVLVTLEKTPKTDIWEKCELAVASVPSVQHIVTCSVFDWMGGALGAAMRLISKTRRSSLTVAGRSVPVTRFTAMIQGMRADDLEFAPPKPSDISTMLCTGGTTGMPKIARRSHASEVFDVWSISQFNPNTFEPGSAALCGLPLFHSNAILVTGLLVFMKGGHVVLATPQGYRGTGVIENFWKIAQHYKIVTFSGVPTVYSALLDVPMKDADLSSIKFAACGAAPMPVELFNRFVKTTGIPIVEGYGMTEGAVASSLNPRDPAGGTRIGSIGLRLPYQKMRCAILNENDEFDRWAKIDEVGVVMISGPNLFEGYIIDSQNQGIFFDISGERWFNSGDLARQDADGYFWMTGRKKELIIRGGHNIDPKMIEEAMHAHPEIVLAAAVGRPDEKAGELPVVYYQSTTGSDLPLQELKDFAQANISERAALPKAFICMDELPLTAIGKIHKPTLNMIEIERTIRTEAETLGAEIEKLRVATDSQKGIVARLKTTTRREELARRLGNFAFAVEFEA